MHLVLAHLVDQMRELDGISDKGEHHVEVEHQRSARAAVLTQRIQRYDDKHTIVNSEIGVSRTSPL